MPLFKILKIQEGLIGIWKINENDLHSNTLINNSSGYHPNFKNYKNKHKKAQVLCTRSLANELFPNHQLAKNDFGKPELRPNSYSISISNTKDLIVMIGSNKKCGIDIESSERNIMKIKDKFINEYDFSYNGNNEDLLWTWCAKECMYKIYGTPEIFFKEHLQIKSIDKNTLVGECCHEKFLFKCQINKMIIDNQFLVYTSNFEAN